MRASSRPVTALYAAPEVSVIDKPAVIEEVMSNLSMQVLQQKLPRQSVRWFHVSTTLYLIILGESMRAHSNLMNLKNFLEVISWRIYGKITEEEFSVLYSEWISSSSSTAAAAANMLLPTTKKSRQASLAATIGPPVISLTTFRCLLLAPSTTAAANNTGCSLERDLDLMLAMLYHEYNLRLLNTTLSYSSSYNNNHSSLSLEVITIPWCQTTERLFFLLDSQTAGSWSFDDCFTFCTILTSGLLSSSSATSIGQQQLTEEEIEADFSSINLVAVTLQFLKDCGCSIAIDGYTYTTTTQHATIASSTASNKLRRSSSQAAQQQQPQSHQLSPNMMKMIAQARSPILSYKQQHQQPPPIAPTSSPSAASTSSVYFTLPLPAFKRYLLKKAISEEQLSMLFTHSLTFLQRIMKYGQLLGEGAELLTSAMVNTAASTQQQQAGLTGVSAGSVASMVTSPKLWSMAVLSMTGYSATAANNSQPASYDTAGNSISGHSYPPLIHYLLVEAMYYLSGIFRAIDLPIQLPTTAGGQHQQQPSALPCFVDNPAHRLVQLQQQAQQQAQQMMMAMAVDENPLTSAQAANLEVYETANRIYTHFLLANGQQAGSSNSHHHQGNNNSDPVYHVIIRILYQCKFLQSMFTAACMDIHSPSAATAGTGSMQPQQHQQTMYDDLADHEQQLDDYDQLANSNSSNSPLSILCAQLLPNDSEMLLALGAATITLPPTPQLVQHQQLEEGGNYSELDGNGGDGNSMMIMQSLMNIPAAMEADRRRQSTITATSANNNNSSFNNATTAGEEEIKQRMSNNNNHQQQQQQQQPANSRRATMPANFAAATSVGLEKMAIDELQTQPAARSSSIISQMPFAMERRRSQAATAQSEQPIQPSGGQPANKKAASNGGVNSPRFLQPTTSSLQRTASNNRMDISIIREEATTEDEDRFLVSYANTPSRPPLSSSATVAAQQAPPQWTNLLDTRHTNNNAYNNNNNNSNSTNQVVAADDPQIQRLLQQLLLLPAEDVTGQLALLQQVHALRSSSTTNAAANSNNNSTSKVEAAKRAVAVAAQEEEESTSNNSSVMMNEGNSSSASINGGGGAPSSIQEMLKQGQSPGKYAAMLREILRKMSRADSQVRLQSLEQVIQLGQSIVQQDQEEKRKQQSQQVQQLQQHQPQPPMVSATSTLPSSSSSMQHSHSGSSILQLSNSNGMPKPQSTMQQSSMQPPAAMQPIQRHQSMPPTLISKQQAMSASTSSQQAAVVGNGIKAVRRMSAAPGALPSGSDMNGKKPNKVFGHPV